MAITQKQKDAAKAYRVRLMTAARAGGYTPSKRTGTGLTQKKTSKHGTTYYYQAWNTLSGAQKADRLKYSRDYSKRTRMEAAAYRAEHGK